MFSDGIYISLKNQNLGKETKPLLYSDRFQEIKNHYENSSKEYSAATDAAYDTATLIREEISFSPHTANQPALSPDWINTGHQTNCHGHSIIASECLDELGIEHYIGFANGHSFLLMQDNDSGRVDLIDTPDKKLCIEITPALGGIALQESINQKGSANFISGNTILNLSKFDDKELGFYRRPWLSFAKKADSSFWSEEHKDRASQLILRTYEPEQGRAVLLSYDHFIHAILRNNTLEAHQWLEDLDGTYPDIDRRNHLRAPTQLVRSLGMKALTDEALRDIQIIKNSLEPFTNDLILNLWPADERRRLGVRFGSRRMLKDSLEDYDRIYESRKEAGHSTEDIKNRIRKTKTQLSQIAVSRAFRP